MNAEGASASFDATAKSGSTTYRHLHILVAEIGIAQIDHGPAVR